MYYIIYNTIASVTLDNTFHYFYPINRKIVQPVSYTLVTFETTCYFLLILQVY